MNKNTSKLCFFPFVAMPPLEFEKGETEGKIGKRGKGWEKEGSQREEREKKGKWV